MPFRVPQVALLRLAAFLIDALSISLLLVLPASAISYILAWAHGTTRAVNIVWFAALAVLLGAMLIRDGLRGGRSPGKTLLGLVVVTRSGRPCGMGRSILRNIPLLIPLWNLIELLLVLFGRRRTGDLLAGVTVVEE